MREMLRRLFLSLGIPLTTNLKNDILLKRILKRVLQPTDNAVDVGCHKGEILAFFLSYAPQGRHFGIEPIPDLYTNLKKRFPQAEIFPYAVADREDESEFYWIKDKPAYSGLRKRAFSSQSMAIEPIKVQVKRLDDILPGSVRVRFIKIDVEGAEWQVLQGAKRIIEQDRPFIAFEFGLGGSDYYGGTPEKVFDFFESQGYLLYDYASYLRNGMPYNKVSFVETYRENRIYNFLAVPGRWE
ncbi:MAG: FkbM family methyltransferase [Bacteroidia bacterium]